MNNRIVRCGRREDVFARVDKAMLDDARLSWKAKGILAYLMGKPDSWKLRVSDLVNRSSDGKHSIRAALKELRDAGYAELVAIKEKGRITEWIWKVSDCPIFPDTDFPHLENPVLENQHLSKNNSRKNDSSKNERSKETQDLQSSDLPFSCRGEEGNEVALSSRAPERDDFLAFTAENCPALHDVGRDERLYDELRQRSWHDTGTPPRPIKRWREYVLALEDRVASVF